MKITDVRTAIIRGHRDWVLVRVYTDEGITGLGEAHFGPAVEEMIIKGLKNLLVGQNPLDVERLYTTMLNRTWGYSTAGGLVVMAITGVELALWDLAGRALGVPIYRLLGGKYRDRIRVYADVAQGATNTPQDWAARAKEIVAEGFTAVKFDIDGKAQEFQLDTYNRTISRLELRKMAQLVAAARGGVGPDVDLAIDCHGRFNVPDALRLARALEEFDLFFLEDPVPPENVEAMEVVVKSARMPICTGENYYKKEGFRELITRQACHILHPDLNKVGGLLDGKKIADLADIYSMAFAIHVGSSPVGMLAGVHAAASIKNFMVMEHHAHKTDVPWWQDLVTGPKPIIVNGYIKVPDGPGLGVELDEKVARAHLKPGSGLFEPSG